MLASSVYAKKWPCLCTHVASLMGLRGPKIAVSLVCVYKGSNRYRLFKIHIARSDCDSTRASFLKQGQNFVELSLVVALAECRRRFKVFAAEVCLPGCMDAGWVFLPLLMHSFDVVGV